MAKARKEKTQEERDQAWAKLTMQEKRWVLEVANFFNKPRTALGIILDCLSPDHGDLNFVKDADGDTRSIVAFFHQHRQMRAKRKMFGTPHDVAILETELCERTHRGHHYPRPTACPSLCAQEGMEPHFSVYKLPRQL